MKNGVDDLEDDCLHEDVLTQLETLQLVPDRPLIISDADEVIFAFVRGLEAYLLDNGHFMDLKSFAMRGNIRESETGEAVSAQVVKELINSYFLERTEQIEPVDGAAAALEALAQRGITRLLIEGGSTIATAFLSAGLVDRVAWFRASGIMGGDGLPVFGDLGLTVLDKMPRFRRTEIETLGDDVLESYVHQA